MNTVEVHSVNGGVNIVKEANDNLPAFKRVIASIKSVFASIINFFKNILGGKH